VEVADFFADDALRVAICRLPSIRRRPPGTIGAVIGDRLPDAGVARAALVRAVA
jgi:hypothetical protein